jgi:hypothetical protein
MDWIGIGHDIADLHELVYPNDDFLRQVTEDYLSAIELEFPASILAVISYLFSDGA